MENAALAAATLAGTIAAMVREGEIRRGELAVAMPPATDAGLVFIGRIHTPWTSRLATPRQGRLDGPICRIELFEPWLPALDGLDAFERVEVLYWLHLSRRDLLRQSPADDGTTRGTFALRSPVRPNPIGTSIAKLVGIEGAVVLVRAWTASTARRCSTSSRTGACSRRSHRRRRGISKSKARSRVWGQARGRCPCA